MNGRGGRFFAAALARSLQLPPDCTGGKSLVSLQGREHLCIENFKGILSYTCEEIRIRTGRARICVSGKRLQIDCYSRDMIEISGYISGICFEKEDSWNSR